MDKINVDCALIFAIEEEFNILRNTKEVVVKGEYYSFNFNDKDGVKRECIATYVTEPGSHEAYKCLNKLYEVYDPYIQFVIGISGQISDDVKIGDVIIGNCVDKYDYNSKQKNGDLKLSGKTVNLNFLSNHLAQIYNKHSDLYLRWQEKSIEDIHEIFTDLQIKELAEKKFIRSTLSPSFFYGKIATGESVVDDIKLKEAIQEKDRKLLCVDMESYGFADVKGDNSNIIIVRSISDTADGRKKTLDNFSGNSDGIRKLALLNAYHFFNDVLLKSISFPKKENQTDSFVSNSIQVIDENIERKSKEIFVRYSNLFNHLRLGNNLKDSDSIYDYLSDTLQSTDTHGPIVIQGWPGNGKTTLLYSFYKFLLEKQIECYYIDLHQYKKSNKHDIIETFSNDMKLLKKKTAVKYLIIDGIDLFERFFVNENIKLDEHWQSLSVNFEGIVLGITLQDYDNEDDEDRPYYLPPEPKLTIELNNFAFGESNINNLINDLLYINNILPTSKLNAITSFLKETGLKELDWHTANLIVKKIGTYNYDGINSIGKFFFNYSREFFSNIQHLNPIKVASEITFKKFIKEEKLSEEEYRSPIWSFIQMSNTIKQFLIAEHLIVKYSNLSEEFDKSVDDLKHIYAYKINSYFKDNLNRNKKVQRKIFDSVTSKYELLSIFQKPNICYILGRLDDQELSFSAKKFLNTELKKELNSFANGVYKSDDHSYRQHLLLIRTIFISLVYQRDLNASAQYVSFLLSNQEWDDLNRAFHLEYYEDKAYDPLKLGLHNDVMDINFQKTFNKISKKINNVIMNPYKNHYGMVDIELQTISSLALNRHIFGKLDEKIRVGVVDILKRYKDNPVQLIRNMEMKPYIDFVFFMLSKDKATPFSIVNEVLNIKNVKRSGWNFKGMKGETAIERHVENSESVADHTLGAMLIAMMLLPDDIPNDNSYSKIDVLKSILIHDLAEALTGKDISSFLKDESKRKLENDKMKLMFSADIIAGFGSLQEYKKLWENYKSQNTTTAVIAREIDKMEQLYQLLTYHDNEKNLISDFVEWKNELIEEVKTPTGKNILTMLLAKNN